MTGAYVDGHLPLDCWQAATMPALVLEGGSTFAFMRTAADAVAASLPNATRIMLDGQGHGADPAVLASVLHDFFSA